MIDGNSLIHRAFHALPPTMTAPDGRPTNAAFGFISMLLKMIADLRPDGIVVAFDLGKPAFRVEALAQYKVHRPPTDPQLKAQFPMVKELLGALDVPIVELEGWEGDDILGTLARRGSEAGIRMLLVTGDRDAFQLVTDDVSVVTTKKGITDIVIYGPAEVLERYGVTPAQVPDYLGLKGDTSDNIPGVPGVGEKTAAKLLQEYGSLDEVLAHAEEIKGKVGENLRENRDAALASRTVATIDCDVPVDIDLTAVEFGAFDPHALAAAFGELRFTSLLDRALACAARAAARSGVAAPVDGRSGATAGAPARWPLRLHRIPPRAAESGRASWGRTGAARVARVGIAPADAWLGVAIDDGAGASLFGDHRDLAVAGRDEIAMSDPEGADSVLPELLLRTAALPRAMPRPCCRRSVRRTRRARVTRRSTPWTPRASSTSRSRPTCSSRTALPTNSRALHADYLGEPLPDADDDDGARGHTRASCSRPRARTRAPSRSGRLAGRVSHDRDAARSRCSCAWSAWASGSTRACSRASRQMP